MRRPVLAVAVQSSESLLQRIDAGDFCHQPVEIEIRAHLNTLGRNHEHNLLRVPIAPEPNPGLVTEVASIDALEQRFGRLDRDGKHGTTHAAIVAQKDEVAKKYEDMLYGPSMAATR